MVAVSVVSSAAPPGELDRLARRPTASARLPARDPRLDAERVGARERQRVRAAVGLPRCTSSGTATWSKREPERAAEARVLDGDGPVVEIGQEDVVVASRHSGPGTSRRSARAAVARAARAATARADRARAAPCPPRPRAASRSCAPARAAGSRPRGTAAPSTSGGPRRDGAPRSETVLDALAQRQRRRAALEPHAALERERRAPAAHAADQLDGVAAGAATLTSHGRTRDLAVERQLGAAVRAGVVAAREQLLPAAARSCARNAMPSEPSRGGAPGGCRPQGDLKSTSTPVERSRNS